jgi:hypothetical protein
MVVLVLQVILSVTRALQPHHLNSPNTKASPKHSFTTLQRNNFYLKTPIDAAYKREIVDYRD